jgi:lipopolysaccharide export system ATP-binding protein
MRGIGVLITDHNVHETLEITQRAYIINDGTILQAGAPEEIATSPLVKALYLGEHFAWQGAGAGRERL